MRIRRFRCWTCEPLLVAWGIFVAAGCGGGGITSGPEKQLVTGDVQFDGKPLAEGQIEFIDAAGNPPPRYRATIRAGKFSCECTPGDKRVEILAFGPAGNLPKVPGPGDDAQFIPARFNTESTLRVSIKSGTANQPLKWDLRK